MEDQSPLASPDGSRRRNPQERRLHPPYSRESASEKRSVGHNPQYRVGGSNEDFIVVKVEDDDKTYKPYKEEEIPADSGAELGISRRTRRRLKAEEDEEPVVKDEELSPEMNAGGAYFTPGGLIISEPSNMEVNEESYYADHESQYLNNSWRGAWRQGHEWNLEEASQNGKEASRRLTSRESALARMRPSTRHGSRPNTSPTMILEKDKHLRDSRGDWGQTSISSSHFGQATAVYHHNVEDFDDNEDEEANTQTGVNKMRNVRFSERENMVLVERVISNFDILVGKLAARTEMSVKTHVWRQITEAVNAVGSLSRTVSNCKKRYQDIKRSIRRKCQKQRAHSRPKYLKPYERILRPYIHVHIRVRTTGGYHFQLEAESESDADLCESPHSLEEPLKVSFYPEPEEGTMAMLPESMFLDDKPDHYNQTESEAATPQVYPESSSNETLFSNDKSGPQQRPSALDHRRSFAKRKIPKLGDCEIRRFQREQRLHRKMLFRKLNALHEDVCLLTQTFGEATTVRNNLLGRIVSALEERNQIKTEQQNTRQRMSESLERTCTSQITNG